LIVALGALHAPPAIAQLVSPVHESNIELCRRVWQDRPDQEKRCLIARRDLVETLERNPYAHAPTTSSTCHGWINAYSELDGQPRTLKKCCERTEAEEAADLSFWYTYFNSAIADAVMWNEPHSDQVTSARRDLGRLEWCGSKYRTSADSMNYHDVLECVPLSEPRSDNPYLYKFGPSRQSVFDLDLRQLEYSQRARAAAEVRRAKKRPRSRHQRRQRHNHRQQHRRDRRLRHHLEGGAAEILGQASSLESSLCLSSASGRGSRPRKALKTCIAGRLPPSASTVSR
jgi:hypothetical protein